MLPSVTVVIPTYDRAPVLSQADYKRLKDATVECCRKAGVLPATDVK